MSNRRPPGRLLAWRWMPPSDPSGRPWTGRTLAAASAEEAVVWSGMLYGGACAATSLCTVQAFFCSDEHLERWRARGPAGGASGFRLSLEEAFQFGRAIFAPMLSPSKAAF